LIPAERGWLDWDQVPELSSIIAGQTRGRQSDSEITIFESQGLGLQDVATAALVYEKATEAGRGEQLSFFEP
jgi:ornithine cyclodeaminase/alanine dehydrogenase-like protein (mu-crystallin family)